MNEKELMNIRIKLDELQKRSDKAKWELENVEKDMKSLGVNTLEEAHQKVAFLDMEIENIEKQLDQLWTNTNETFKALLDLV